MQKDDTMNKIISWICIISGIALLIMFLGDFILKLIGAAAATWLIIYGINLQGLSTKSFYIIIKEKFKN
ncbi:hypothetical protein A3F66_01115 [candidate division TM6 bacterium RIFCSPHIGHO2_12_FULL_32_22]|nr:MAG: hypothetical protein A3F66_01115 [candidate division TM6 bacterium RIFCSPHIGHO2_12_FULL_32_22]